jgi:putative flippase GtrA
MFTDLNLTDMETCYKVFRREVIQGIEIQEDRFGFEPEIVAKVAQKRLRIYEMGISYYGRTYEEGKKIGLRDGFRALYCIFRYNAHCAPVPIQFAIYSVIGGIAALANVAAFLSLLALGLELTSATVLAFIGAAALNYLLCVRILFRRRARWSSLGEFVVYSLVVVASGGLDLGTTWALIGLGTSPWAAKAVACAAGLLFNFLGRRFLVFPEKRRKMRRSPLPGPVGGCCEEAREGRDSTAPDGGAVLTAEGG